ncbi:putative protein kinase RLK-Pelle-LRR-III family [Helianthus annuus]|nr:putative protein kinase RLK-Pelle-LRR-III family [Helianthus annuus]KAJ0506370.1 putative protein kinase RLK-Pelle-LRR-III family [Helianthus annuus]KAJ0676046.1 putative protein kinase RLK-Pelle-LRR-III family [Helianthus annuus]KAJ0679288.1 putative protein kinase RLK-Pelle-LRR-III family [Helianthus annuus]
MDKSPLFLSLLLLLSTLISTTTSDLAADRSAILSIRSAVGGRSILWNISQPATPCTWPGVVCDNKTNRVVELHFPGMGLSGELPANTLGNLTQLTTLSLRFNALSGPLPTDVTSSKDVGENKQVEIEVENQNRNPKVKSGENVDSYSSLSSSVAGGGGGAKGKSGEVSKKLVFFNKNKELGKFDLEDLLRASAEVLGKGTFGTAYKAVLEMGFAVAVKRLKDVTMADKELREKIEGVGAMDHENLVPLRAYYCNGEEKLLVYDYMPMGSLSALLHGNRGAGRTPLNWETRSAIALGAARGITYLHAQGPTVSHGNIKSSNILLTTSYESRVSDFGLAQLVGPNATPTRVDGYRAPEVTDIRKVSQKADVYSFGVLLLELLTGKAPTHALLNDEGVDLPRWVQSVVREEWTSEVFDLELLRYQNVEDDMVQLLQLAIECCAQYPDKRPAMVDVSNQIEELCGGSSGLQQHGPSPIHDIVSDS